MIPNTIKHAEFCLPRSGETEPRIESYRTERSHGAGTVIARPRVVRCIECGEQTVEG